MMTPDELRALADALDHMIPVTWPEKMHDMTALIQAAAYLRAQADAQPVAWIGPSRPRDDGADYRVLRQDYDASHGYGWSRDTAKANGFLPLYAHPAPAAPQAEPKPTPASGDDLNVYKEMADNYRNDVQAEPKREDQPLRDLLAIIHCDGGHHTEAVGLDQSIKDAQAAVCELKRELAMAKREPLSDEQIEIPDYLRLQIACTAAAHDVLVERRRQIEVEGWTPEHDDEHDTGALALAAAAYALDAGDKSHPCSQGARGGEAPSFWPWHGGRPREARWWKPSDPRRNLVKAGALILAEIERLDRMGGSDER